MLLSVHATTLLPARNHDRTRGPVLDVVIPVFNEEADLEPCVRRLYAHLERELPYAYRITIADNASTDDTPQVAARLAAELPEVAVLRLEEKGRGRALRNAWSASDADVLAYMDVDLSTDLGALLPLVAPLVSGHSHLAIGTRLARGSHVVRGPGREVVSRCYNLLLKGALGVRFSDAQCGFKAVRRDAAAALLPHVRDTGWFFDTELLVLAERSGLRVHEVPVDWIDDPDSTVDIVATALADLRGVARLGRDLLTGALPTRRIRAALVPARDEHPTFAGQVARFAMVGAASTVAYLVLYAVLRTVLGPQAANLLALLVTAVGNTAANRYLTFGVQGRDGVWRHHAQGLALFAVGLGLTAGALAGLRLVAPGAGRAAELSVLVVANLAATVVRFVALRVWVFAQRRTAPVAEVRP
jgi:putative flippase GtrA